MKKILLTTLNLLVFSITISGQVGINTTNPQAILHIDGGKDNNTTGTPTTTQQTNDVVITSVGNLGIGTSTPTASLDVSTGNVRVRNINSNFGVVDDRVVIADANGVLKTTSDLPRRSVYYIPVVAPNESQSIDVTASNFQYAQINIITGNQCGRTMITTFSKADDVINFLGGQARNIPGEWILTNLNGNSGSMKFPNVLGCGDGGNGTQFDFEIGIVGNTVKITNRGNINRDYTIRVITNL